MKFSKEDIDKIRFHITNMVDSSKELYNKKISKDVEQWNKKEKDLREYIKEAIQDEDYKLAETLRDKLNELHREL